jgi:hypothetical protein
MRDGIIPSDMSRWATKYTDEQKTAAAAAKLDQNMTAARIQELARAGELTYKGHKLPPFEIGSRAIYTARDRLRAQRMGKRDGAATMEPEDMVAALKRRLLAAAEDELQHLEKGQNARQRKPADPEMLRQIARAVREAAALPSKGEKTIAPGHHNPESNKVEGGQTRGGLGASILASSRQRPAPEPPNPETTQAENGTENTSDGGEQGQTSVQTHEEVAPDPSQRALLAHVHQHGEQRVA